MAIDNQPAGTREDATERRLMAFELRKQGFSYREIGATLGVSGKTAHGDVQQVLTELQALALSSAAEYVQIECERLDAAVQALAPLLDSGDPQIVNAWIKLSESRRKLLGLDAPTKIAPVNADGTPYQAYTELRTVILTMLPMEQRLLLAEALDKVIDATTVDRPDDSA
jgi:hypothetical protein